ncbi:MAG: hypothetical protein KIT08_03850 [Anaerolineales bacterium]|nr:MAG: hypothetical protein KIT08_03850 [Anaerolineales bacterium]
MTEPPQFSNWQEAWEWHARQTSDHFEAQTAEELLAQITAGHYDGYYTIWYRLREKVSLAQAAPVLLDVLRREADDLIRYHCAAALFYLMGHTDDAPPPLRPRVQWAHKGEAARQAAIDELEQSLAE